MTAFDLLTLALGLSLFLFGMTLMGDTLKKSAGGRLKIILGRLTDSKLKGFALGIVITAIIQSSSATTVMVVGFVNAGTMTLTQAVTVIMGANVGTTVTSWLMAFSSIDGASTVNSVMQLFKPSTFTPVIAFVGLLFYMGGKNDKKKSIGLILLGFSVLMIGMDTMSESVSSLSDNPNFRSILMRFENPILGVLAGAVLTAIMQSSSASIGILQSFTSTGAITLGNAVPIIMGQNIGTCVTALISATGASKNARRTAAVHLLFNVFGSVSCLIIFYTVKNVMGAELLNGNIDMWGIAVVHTLFNLITVLVLLPLSSQVERLAVKLVRESREGDVGSMFDERLTATPSVALEQSRKGVIDMADSSVKALNIACSIIGDYNEKYAQSVRSYENKTDEYEDMIGTYLVRTSEKSILDSEKKEASKLLRVIGDLERIADHAVNIVESSQEIRDKKMVFSDVGNRELSVLITAVSEITQITYNIIANEDYDLALRVEPLEQVIDGLRDTIKKNHIARLQNNQCSIEHGFVLSDILHDLERVADHCSNIAGCYIETSIYNSFELHKYLGKYRKETQGFDKIFEEFAQKYKLE